MATQRDAAAGRRRRPARACSDVAALAQVGARVRAVGRRIAPAGAPSAARTASKRALPPRRRRRSTGAGAEPADPLDRRLARSRSRQASIARRAAVRSRAQAAGASSRAQRVELALSARGLGDARAVGVEERLVAAEHEAADAGLLVDQRVASTSAVLAATSTRSTTRVAGLRSAGGEAIRAAPIGDERRHRQHAGAEREPRSAALSRLRAHQPALRPPVSRSAATSSSSAPPLSSQDRVDEVGDERRGLLGPARAGVDAGQQRDQAVHRPAGRSPTAAARPSIRPSV